MMTGTEALMRGDLLRLKGNKHAVRVAEMTDSTYVVRTAACEEYEVYGSELSPIPLTEELLLLNGYKVGKDREFSITYAPYTICYITTLQRINGTEWVLKMYDSDKSKANDKPLLLAFLDSLHELQMLLRFMRLEDEANEIKAE